MTVKTRRKAHAASPAAAIDPRGNGATERANRASQPNNSNGKGPAIIKRTESRSVFAAHPGAPKRVRVFVLTYFFSSLTIDRWRVLWGLVPIGWIFSSLAEWLGVPICHTNVQVSASSTHA